MERKINYHTFYLGEERKQKQSEYYYDRKTGKKEGKYRSWHLNGKLSTECEYKNGEYEGLYKSYHDSGQPFEEVNYKGGVGEGTYKRWNYYGQLMEEYERRNGLREGLVTTYYDNGNKREEKFFKNNLEEGIAKRWYYKSETVCDECNYKLGNKDGEYKSWFDTGFKHVECNYKNDKIEGKCIYWSEGKIEKIYEYKGNQVVKVISLKDGRDRECVLPENTTIEVWKACLSKKPTINSFVYVKLLVPAEAKRVTTTDGGSRKVYKSRVEFAKVLEIVDKEGNKYDEAESFVYGKTKLIYVVGNEVRPDIYDSDPEHECSFGINVHPYIDLCDTWRQ
jgi:antitoxin component YwqK of YwqJK toxin-antitoxin module